MNRLWKLVFGQGLVAHARGPRLAGRMADASGAARLAGRRVRGERLGRQAPGPDARDLRHLPADVARARRTLVERDPDNRLYARQVALPARRRAGPRQRARRQRRSPRAGWAAPSVHSYQPTRLLGLPELPAARVGRLDRRGPVPPRGSTRGGSARSRSRAWSPSTRPSREECVGRAHARRTCPSRRSALLNDPTYVEAARVFAERILREGGTTLRATGCAGPTRAALGARRATEEARILGERSCEHGSAEYRPDPRPRRRLRRPGRPVPRPTSTSTRSWPAGPRWRGRS